MNTTPFCAGSQALVPAGTKCGQPFSRTWRVAYPGTGVRSSIVNAAFLPLTSDSVFKDGVVKRVSVCKEKIQTNQNKKEPEIRPRYHNVTSMIVTPMHIPLLSSQRKNVLSVHIFFSFSFTFQFFFPFFMRYHYFFLTRCPFFCSNYAWRCLFQDRALDSTLSGIQLEVRI